MWQPLLLVALLARSTEPQAPDTTHRASGATVTGVVHDSVARAPLVGATVQLVAAASLARFGRTAVSDSMGRYVLVEVPDGRYRIGFFHPMLESLGLEPPVRELLVNSRAPVLADLAIPSPERLRVAVCGPPSPESGAVVVGVVRDAQDRAPAPGVRVSAEWLELTFGPRGPVRHVQRLVAITAENGWFAMCNVPSAGTMFLIASRGADSTDLIEVQVQGEGFLRRELFIAPSRDDSTTPAARRAAAGNGRLSGTVVSAAEGRPVSDAQVGIAGGPVTRANERGEWTLLGAPEGTRMLDVRAFGYYPERRRVDVVAGATPIRIALSTLEAVLDTVKVTDRSRRPRGFQERHRSAGGRYLSSEDIARRHPTVVSDLFRMMPGIHLQRDVNGPDIRLRMPGAFGPCAPTIYLDGLSLGDRLTTDEIDTWVRPNDIVGIEIYSEASVPAEFHQGLNGRNDALACGAMLIWTR